MKKTVTAGGVVVNSKGEVLVVAQRNNAWSLPKGHVDPGETIEQAAIREIYEESGLKQLELVLKLGEYKRFRLSINGQDDKSEEKTIHIFLFKTKEMDLKPIDPENPEAKWLKKNEVCNFLTHQKDKDFFHDILEKI